MATGAAPGDFDLFALRQQWAPQWCVRSEMDSSMSWCRPSMLRRRSDGGSFMALHGLWPQYNSTRPRQTSQNSTVDADWPQFCGKFADCGGEKQSLLERCRLPAAVRASHYESFMGLAPAWVYQKGGGDLNYGDHEWAKHGSCTGLDAEIFTSDSMGLTDSLPAPRAIIDKQGSSIHLASLLKMYNFSRDDDGIADRGEGVIAAFACDEGGYLFGVTTCWTRAKNGSPLRRRLCPSNIAKSAYSNSCVNRSSVLIRAGQPESIWLAPGGTLFLVCLISVASVLIVAGVVTLARIILRRMRSSRRLNMYNKRKNSARTPLMSDR